MSRDDKKILSAIVCEKIISCNSSEMALGAVRYDTLRRLNRFQYDDLCSRNLKGENFDGMIDEMIVQRQKGHPAK